MLKKKLQMLSVALITSVLLVSSADASIYVKLFNGPGNGNGGEFKLAIDQNYNGTFAADINTRTFCVEITENISFGTAYKVAGITTGTVLSGKALTLETAALFKAFYSGIGTTVASTILGVNYRRSADENDANYNADARSLQLAIWHTMGWHTTWSSSYANEYAADTKAQAFVAAATTYAGNNFDAGFYGVRVLNLTNSSGSQNFQDQLTVIPEPGSIAIWGLLTLGVAGISNKRRRK